MSEPRHPAPAGETGGFASHLLVDYLACDADRVRDPELVQDALERAARAAGATIVRSFFHRFEPHGVSGVVIVKESHLTVHTWPERGYAAVDIFLCGRPPGLDAARRVLSEAFRARDERVRSVARGEPS